MSKDQASPIISNSKIEFWFLGGLILFGAAFRGWRFFDLGIIHYDEGVYAISGLGTMAPFDEVHLYAKQILFSPPLYFSLVGFSYRILGEASDTAAILVNVVIGVTTIALVWWFTRRWFGRGAGIAAAVLVAFSDFHIAYSRMVLTDIAFSFFFLFALALIAATMERVNLRLAIVSGIVVGAAWNTKYHGWLLLLLALIVLVIIAMKGRNRNDKSLWKRLCIYWIVMTAVAAACYLPWAIYVQAQPGGYPSLMKYQRTMLDPNWLKNLWRQGEMQLYMDGWLSRISPVVAFLLALAIGDRRRWNLKSILLVLIMMLCSGIFLGGVGTALILSVLAIPILIKRRSYACWLVLASVGLFSLLTPLYHPYARLLMPWVLSVYIAGGVGMEKITSNANIIEWKPWRNKRLIWVVLAAGMILFIVLFGITIGFRSTPRTWMATDSVREAAATIAEKVSEDSLILVLGAPEVVFYLRLYGHQAIPIDQLIDHPDVKTLYNSTEENLFLVTGIYAQHRAPTLRASLKRLESRLNPVGVFPIQPNDVRLLDDFTPNGAMQYRLSPSKEYDLHLYKVLLATP